MDTCLLVATDAGLWEVETGRSRGRADGERRRVDALADRPVRALARDGDRVWAVVDGCSLWARDANGGWQEVAPITGPPGTCVAATPAGVLVGTEEARVFRLADGKLERVDSFDDVAGRDAWYTPWGDPPDVRSIALGVDGTIYVNVHVGGVVRSADGGRSWVPTLDIEADVHQVLAHPTRAGVVLVAAAIGFGVSRDAGASWEYLTTGLHAHYLRAVTVAGDSVLVSASTGFRGRQSALYRKPLDGAAAFERCREGLPRWFGDNVDTACLAAQGAVVAFGTEDGRVFRSLDAGERWNLVAESLGPVRSVVLR